MDSVVSAVPSSFITLSGNGDVSEDLVSRVLAAYSYRIALTGAAPSANGGLAFGAVSVTRVDSTSLAVTVAVPLSVAGVPVLVTLPATGVLFGPGMMRVGVTAVANVVSLDLTVTNLVSLTETVQRAMDNDTTLAAVAVSGDAAVTHVVGRVLTRVQIPPLQLRTLINGVPAAVGAALSTARVGLTSVELVSMTTTLATIKLRLFNTLTGPLTGTIPSQTLVVKQAAPTARNCASATISLALNNVSAVEGTVAVTATPTTAAAALQDLVTTSATTTITLSGATVTSSADVIARVLGGLLFTLKAAGGPAAPAAPSTTKAVAIKSLTLNGNVGTQDVPVIVVDALLDWAGLSNTIFIGTLPSLGVRVSNAGTGFATLTTPTVVFAPNAPVPTVFSLRVLIDRNAQIAAILDSVFEKKKVSLSVTGMQTGGNLVQTVLDAFTYTASIDPPAGSTVGGGGVLPALDLAYVTSTANTLQLSIAYAFSNPAAFAVIVATPTLSAQYQGQQIITASITSSTTITPGANRLTAAITITADTTARRSNLEAFAAAAFAGKAAPLRILGSIPAPNPVRFAYDFTLPANANGNNAASNTGSNELIPCVETGLTTPFDGTWSFGKCVPLTGCRCGLNDLCAVGRSSPECSSSSLSSRCVENKVELIVHLYLRNPLPLTLRLVAATADS